MDFDHACPFQRQIETADAREQTDEAKWVRYRSNLTMPRPHRRQR
jgi:hypothetical protein